MKKLLILSVCVLFVCTQAAAWSRQGHATIAKIAENHLTPEAKARITEMLHGRSIVYYASYADDYKNRLIVDLGFDPTNWNRMSELPHTFEANEDCTPFRGLNRDGEYVKNCLYFIEKIRNELEHPEKMSDTIKVQAIALLVHFVGDMHCPMHIRYPDDQTIGKFDVTFRGAKKTLHSLWDSSVLTVKHPWSFTDIASLLDTYTEPEIAEITKGGVWDWGYESAKLSRPVHNVKPGAVLDMEFILENKPLTESQIAKAGYRLAKMLNDLFGN